jgi:hypothetical protein
VPLPKGISGTLCCAQISRANHIQPAGIVIELLFREDTSDEWPDALIQALAEIVQTDPVNDLDSIRLRVTSKYDEAAGEVVPKWEFLNSTSAGNHND